MTDYQVHLEPCRLWGRGVCSPSLLHSVDARGDPEMLLTIIPTHSCRSSFTTAWRRSSCSGRWAGPSSWPSCYTCVQVAVLYHTGHIVYAIAVHTKSACAPNYLHFPWGVQVPTPPQSWWLFTIVVDIQVCSLKFGSWINSQYNVEYRLPRDSTVGLSDFQQTVGWQVVNTKSR